MTPIFLLESSRRWTQGTRRLPFQCEASMMAVSAGHANPLQRLKTSSIQSDHSALRQIIGSQKKSGIACLPFVGTKSALGGPDAESALVPLYVGTPAVPPHLIHNILRYR